MVDRTTRALVADAEVFVLGGDYRRRDALARFASDPVLRRAVPHHVTDGAGLAWLPAAMSDEARELLAIAGDRRGRLSASSSADLVEIEVAVPDVQCVRVVDALGQPSPGVSVAFGHVDGQRWLDVEACTGRDGIATFSDLDLSSLRADCIVWPPSIGTNPPTARVRRPRARSDPLELRLPPAGRIHVVVHVQDGGLLDVVAMPGPAQGDAPNVLFRMFQDTTSRSAGGRVIREDRVPPRTIVRQLDGRASCELDPVALGAPLRIEVLVPGFAPVTWSGTTPPTPGETRQVELTLGPPLQCARGRVVDSDGSVIPATRRLLVAFEAPIGGETNFRSREELVHAADGAFTIAALPARLATPRVRWVVMDDFPPERAHTRAIVDLDGPLAARPTIDVGEVRLQRSTSLVSGRVVDARGSPVARVRVLARLAATTYPSDHADAWSNEDGEFSLQGFVPLRTDCVVMARRREQDSWSEPVEFRAGSEGVLVILPDPPAAAVPANARTSVAVEELPFELEIAFFPPFDASDEPLTSSFSFGGRLVEVRADPGDYGVRLLARRIEQVDGCVSMIRERLYPPETAIPVRLVEGIGPIRVDFRLDPEAPLAVMDAFLDGSW